MNRRDFLLRAAAAPLLLSATPDALAARRGGTPIALVTADTQAKVVAVDLSRGRVVREVAVMPGPRSIETVAGTVAVVAHTTEGAVCLVDGPSLTARRVRAAFEKPRYTAAARDGRHAYVTDEASGEVVVLDAVRGRVVHRSEVGALARHVSLDPSGRWLWVALGFKARELVVLDVAEPLRPRVAARIRPPFLAHDVGVAPGGRRVWVTSGAERRLAVYDAWSRRVLFTLPADAPPQHVTFSDELAYVASGDDGTVHVHALGDGRLLRTTRVPVGSYNVQHGWGRILTPSLDRGTLSVLSGRGVLLEQVQVAPSSHDACFLTSG